MSNELRDSLLKAYMAFNGGWENGGYTVGFSQSLQTLVILALEERDDEFIDGLACFGMHLVWMSAPLHVCDEYTTMLRETMEANGLSAELVDELVTSGLSHLEKLAELQPVRVGPHTVRLKGGEVINDDELFGLGGTTFMEDAAALTYEEIHMHDDYAVFRDVISASDEDKQGFH